MNWASGMSEEARVGSARLLSDRDKKPIRALECSMIFVAVAAAEIPAAVPAAEMVVCRVCMALLLIAGARSGMDSLCEVAGQSERKVCM